MNDHTIAAAGNAPRGCEPGEGTREVHAPSQPAAARPGEPVALTNADAERLRAQCLALMSLADELGLFMLTINIHNVTEPTAFEVIPDGTDHIGTLASTGRRYGMRRLGRRFHELSLYTGDAGEAS